MDTALVVVALVAAAVGLGVVVLFFVGPWR